MTYIMYKANHQELKFERMRKRQAMKSLIRKINHAANWLSKYEMDASFFAIIKHSIFHK